MAMNTPIGNITQITPISSFVTLQSVALDQYLLGINNFVQGDGSKVTLQNLIASMVNTTNDKNILSLDENGRLQAIEAVNPFGNDNGWAVAPTLTVDWTNRTVSGTGGKAYKDGFEITALSNFTSPAFPSEVGAYYLYYNGTNLIWQSGSKPDSKYLIAKISVDSNDVKMAADAWGVGGVNETISNFLNAALGTIVLSGGEIGNVTTDVEITEGNYLQPTLTATTVGMADFSKLIPALPSGSYTRVHTANNQLVYNTAQSGIVPTHSGNIPIIIDNAGNENEIALECCTNVWVVGLPLFGEDPANLHYQFVTGSVQYEGTNDAKAASPMAEIAMQYIDNQYDRYAIIARFTIQRTENGYMCVDYEIYNPLQGGGGAGGTGITEVVSDPFYFSGLGLPSSPLTASPATESKLKQVVEDKENIYKILEGHKSVDGKLWNLIEYHDATDKDNLILGGDSRFTSNTSDADFHFGLLNSIAGSNQPDATAQLNVYKVFNKSHWDSQTDPIYTTDGTITIACRKKMRISRIEIRVYDTYYCIPQTHICGLNLAEPLVRDITLSDFANAHYIGGQSITKEASYNQPTNERWGLNRPHYLQLNERDYYNVFFICCDNWCSGEQGWNRRIDGIRIYGSVEETEDGDLTAGSDKLLQVLGDYDVKMNGKGFNKNAFTVVGNPTITRNGIATLLNSAGSRQGLRKAVEQFVGGSDWEVGAKVKITQQRTDTIHETFICLATNPLGVETSNGFKVGLNASLTRAVVLLRNQDNTSWLIQNSDILLNNIQILNVWHKFKLTYKNQQIGLYCDDILLFQQNLNLDDYNFAVDFSFGVATAQQGMIGELDEKECYVKQNGETVLDGGIDYEPCEWVSSNGTVYNVSDLIDQYGEIPQERIEHDRWISCFGHRWGYTAPQKAVDNYYPCLVDGTITDVGGYSYSMTNICQQTHYMSPPRADVGYYIYSSIYRPTIAQNGNNVWQYEATDVFPAGEYFFEMQGGYYEGGYTDYNYPNCYNIRRFRVECLDAEDNVLYKQTFAYEGDEYDMSPLFRTPRFYLGTEFKKVRVIIASQDFPNGDRFVPQMQMYYRDIEGTNPLSFVMPSTNFDLNTNIVRHVKNKHFFITPTGVRVGSNCFVEKTDPYPQMACVGNRWINENTRLSYVCNESGKWEREDFCEIACMTLWGNEHKGMRLRTVANYENPITKYVQDYGNLGGNLSFDDELLVGQYQVFDTDPDDPDFYFVANHGYDDDCKIRFYYPARTCCLINHRAGIAKSRIYESGQQYAHWSQSQNSGARMIAYKTFETAAAGEYVEESEEI
jgi:hypothetical protein|nr:MAG TPA: hypothetical protein [Caudoviricetes sp.]